METACSNRPKCRDACQPQVVNSMLRSKRAGTDASTIDVLESELRWQRPQLSPPPTHTPPSLNPLQSTRSSSAQAVVGLVRDVRGVVGVVRRVTRKDALHKKSAQAVPYVRGVR